MLKKGDLIRLTRNWCYERKQEKFIGKYGELVLIIGINLQNENFRFLNLMTGVEKDIARVHLVLMETMANTVSMNPSEYYIIEAQDIKYKDLATLRLLYG